MCLVGVFSYRSSWEQLLPPPLRPTGGRPGLGDLRGGGSGGLVLLRLPPSALDTVLLLREATYSIQLFHPEQLITGDVLHSLPHF